MSITSTRRRFMSVTALGVLTAAGRPYGVSAQDAVPAADIAESTMSLVDPQYHDFALGQPAGPILMEYLPSIRASVDATPIPGHPSPKFDVFDMSESAASFFLYRPETPRATPTPAIVYIHGGGYILGSAKSYHAYCYQLAQASGAIVANVEYRLAPETPFPGPVQDCYDVLSYLHSNAKDLGVDPGRVSIMGHSAGGGLTAALAQMARDLGDLPVKAQFPIYPMLDYRTGTTDAPVNNLTTGEFVWGRAANRAGWDSMGGGYKLDDDRKGWFSPTHADTLEGLPPVFMIVGALDLFLEENAAYALALTRAGVSTEFAIYSGAVHAFDLLPHTDLTKRFRTDLKSAFDRLL